MLPSNLNTTRGAYALTAMLVLYEAHSIPRRGRACSIHYTTSAAHRCMVKVNSVNTAVLGWYMKLLEIFILELGRIDVFISACLTVRV